MINKSQTINTCNYNQNFGTLKAEHPQLLPIVDTAIGFVRKIIAVEPSEFLASVVQNATVAQIKADELGTDMLLRVTGTKNGLQYSLKILGLDGISKEIPLSDMSLPENPASHLMRHLQTL